MAGFGHITHFPRHSDSRPPHTILGLLGIPPCLPSISRHSTIGNNLDPSSLCILALALEHCGTSLAKTAKTWTTRIPRLLVCSRRRAHAIRTLPVMSVTKSVRQYLDQPSRKLMCLLMRPRMAKIPGRFRGGRHDYSESQSQNHCDPGALRVLVWPIIGSGSSTQ